ncbi:allantoin racemase [Bacillus mesophilus]|uniref:Hydrogenase expression protein HupH n=1 Tax=Bacillus mesophilus TaxID=1808955 RepID=A0A6M0Q821_9BACI|nr:aspartate/glutamate racemase family protein [Bacillus mesophilus]MBM7662131.1 allantoin racemase [Bacillus mesophilus]NEY72516.1 hydrogenase expression protein HupH [Bacillus mesophilus]
MKIVYVVPGPMNLEEVARRGALLKQWAGEGVQVDISTVADGPASIESMYEEYLSIPQTAKLIYQHEQEGYDAVVLGCAGDPGLDAYREITTNLTIVGPAASSFHTAALLGHRFSVLTVTDSTIASAYELVQKAGLSSKLASVKAVNIPVLELGVDRQATLEKLIAIGKKEIEENGADTLTLGCMSMGFLNVAEDMQEALGIPVINPAKNALKVAEALVGAGYRHSKKAYMVPPKLASGKVKSLDELHVTRVIQ